MSAQVTLFLDSYNIMSERRYLHVDWLGKQLDQIAQLGVPLYLSTQTRD
jgi:bacterioferritin (cytochrome b1)